MNEYHLNMMHLLDRFIAGFEMNIKNCVFADAFPEAEIAPGSHIHPYWEVKLLLRGTARWIGTRSKRAPAVVLYPPGVVHGAHRERDLSATSAMLILTENGHWSLLARQKSRWISPWYGSGDGILRQRLGGSPDELWNALAQDRARLESDPALCAFWTLRLRSAFAAFRLAMHERPPRSLSGGAYLAERALRAIRNEYYLCDLTVAGIARQLGCSVTHLAAVMRKERGLTVRQTLVHTRLDRAQELLREGRHSVKEVAYLTGWRNGFYFSNCFRAYFGVRPSACISAQGKPASGKT